MEHVGAKFNGQASLSTVAFRWQVEFLNMVESTVPEIPMLLMPFEFAYSKSLTKSWVSPLLEIKIKRSFFLNNPKETRFKIFVKRFKRKILIFC